MGQEKTMSSREAAEILGVSMSTVARWVRSGYLKGHKLTRVRNSHLRVSRESVDRLLAERNDQG